MGPAPAIQACMSCEISLSLLLKRGRRVKSKPEPEMVCEISLSLLLKRGRRVKSKPEPEMVWKLAELEERSSASKLNALLCCELYESLGCELLGTPAQVSSTTFLRCRSAVGIAGVAGARRCQADTRGRRLQIGELELRTCACG
jgi:hypothetical protein